MADSFHFLFLIGCIIVMQANENIKNIAAYGELKNEIRKSNQSKIIGYRR